MTTDSGFKNGAYDPVMQLIKGIYIHKDIYSSCLRFDLHTGRSIIVDYDLGTTDEKIKQNLKFLAKSLGFEFCTRDWCFSKSGWTSDEKYYIDTKTIMKSRYHLDTWRYQKINRGKILMSPQNKIEWTVEELKHYLDLKAMLSTD